jgi:Zn-finger nucleic acid-binding protein
VSERCFFCGGLVDGDICQRCGAGRDVRAEKRIHAPCPRCQSTRLIQYALGPVALQACPRCKGSFLPASEWDVLLEAFAHEPLPEVVIVNVASEVPSAGDPYRTAAPVSESESESAPDLEAVVRCPTCDEPMERFEFAGVSGAVIDVCHLHGVWLDAGEVERVVATTQPKVMAPARAEPRGAAPAPVPLASARPPGPMDVKTFARALEETAREVPVEPAPQRHAVVAPPAAPRSTLERTTASVLRPLSQLVRALVARLKGQSRIK